MKLLECEMHQAREVLQDAGFPFKKSFTSLSDACFANVTEMN
jgi:hypothetical protein